MNVKNMLKFIYSNIIKHNINRWSNYDFLRSNQNDKTHDLNKF